MTARGGTAVPPGRHVLPSTRTRSALLSRNGRFFSLRATIAARTTPTVRKRMGRGISEVITFAVGVAISPVPIVAVILMLFSQRARVNGPAFLIGWVAALAVVSVVVYVTADQSDGRHCLVGQDRPRRGVPAPRSTAMAKPSRRGR